MGTRAGLVRAKRAASLERASTSKTPRVDFSIPTKNRFAALTNNDANPQANKPQAPPPITVTDNLTTQFSSVLKELKIKYRLKIISVGTKIYVDTEEDFNTVSKKLSELKIQFFSHPTGANKIFKLMLCGLPEFPTDDIVKYLKENNNIVVKKIVMLNSSNSFRRYILQFDPKENSKADIKNVKTILYHVVKWLPANPSKKGPTQCLYCGMFGHGLSSCHRTPNCFLCGEKHETKNCTFKNDETEQRIFKCYNCKTRNLQHNHRANDPQCPSRLQYIEIKSNMNKKQIKNNTAQQFVHAASAFPQLAPQAPQPPPLNKSFADASRQQQQRPNYSQRNHFASNDNELFTFAEVSEIMLNCVNELAVCTNKLDQLRVIANMLNHAFK